MGKVKKTEVTLLTVIVVAVFLISFLVGRASALRDKGSDNKNSVYSVQKSEIQKNEETKEASSLAKKVEKSEPEKKTEKKENKPDEDPPARMAFPCGKTVLKGYSETAVYSETMGDWRSHCAIDYAAEKGTDVISCGDGTVVKVYKDKLWGKCIEIEHTKNLKSVYKNLESKVNVKKGDKVKEGEVIAKVGKSASIESRETAHLHFELWQDNVPINPQSYVY